MAKAGNSEQIYIKREKENPKKRETIFILCDTCYWCATYFGKFMLPAENRCPNCQDVPAFQYYLMNHLALIIIKKV